MVVMMKTSLSRRQRIYNGIFDRYLQHNIQQYRYLHNRHGHKVKITRNVPYSQKHSRNVMDIYKPITFSSSSSFRTAENSLEVAQTTKKATKQNDRVYETCHRPPTVIFVHGGMWQGGSKDHSPIDMYDIAYSLWDSIQGSGNSGGLSSISSSAISLKNNEGGDGVSKQQQRQSLGAETESNQHRVGLTIAQYGGMAYVINYRLARIMDNSESESHTKEESVASSRDGNIENSCPSRKESNDEETAAHPGQVMDVARAILDVLRRELAFRRNASHVVADKEKGKNCHFEPNVFLCGHSAGAHLAALALSDSKYIMNVLAELKKTENQEDIWNEINIETIRGVLAGFIGISGVYNLRRLATSALADITIGPAFLGAKTGRESEDDDVVSEASPVHALLDAHAHISSATSSGRIRGNKGEGKIDVGHSQIPLLATMPVLLINAESDFHLHHDTTDLTVALGQFGEINKKQKKNIEDNKGDGGENTTIERKSATKQYTEPPQNQQYVEHHIIPERNHLSIMGHFGSGLLLEEKKKETPTNDSPPVLSESSSGTDNQWTWSYLAMQPYNALGYATSNIVSHISGNDGATASSPLLDETAERVLEFMSLRSRGLPADQIKR